MGVKVLQVVNKQDVVPRVLGASALEMLMWTYSHVGVELEVDDEESKHLDQEKATVANYHNLEMYLHLVDGYGR